MTKPIRRIIDAAGGPVALSRELSVTYVAVNGWERAGYMPLKRALEVTARYPGVATVRELVREDLAAAMDRSTADSLLD